MLAKFCVETISLGKPKFIKALKSILAQNSHDEKILLQAAKSLAEINPGNSTTTDTLISSAQNCPPGDLTTDSLVRSLNSISGETQMAEVVTDLKERFSNETSENDYKQYESYYETIWHCAQALPYPTFYQAWHYSPHIPDSQSLNLADLPKRLRATFDRNPDLKDAVQLIYIDGSKFMKPDNPADYIYARIVRHGCPKRADGIPKTMDDLQVYWEMLPMESDRRVFLVFYEDPIAPPQGFSETFLKDLLTFDQAFCVISSQPNIPIRLQRQSFSPNQVNLVVDVVDWIREIILENS